MVSNLCPDIFTGVAGLDTAESECDVGCRGRLVMVMVVMMSATGRPGLSSDEGEASQEHEDSDRVEGLVEGKRVVYGGWGAQIGRC